MKKTVLLFTGIIAALILIAAVATTIDDFFLPGSQVGQSGNIETPDRCDNCHGGYDQAVEPAFNWRGSMMSQAARDPLFYACLAIAEQDAPGVGDMCLRCHTPDGWLNGRCEPTDGSALNNNDREGVQCDFCHKLVKPAPLGTNPFPNDGIYTAETLPQDQSYLATIPLPGGPGNGMYIADANNAKRGPFADAVGRHQMFYSPFHTESDHCGTCHDVSNPVLTRTNVSIPVYSPNEFGKQSETFDVRLMFPIERTYSEWMASGYSIDGDGIDNATCQDCHMRDVTGKGAKMKDAPLRPNLPLHDMTGGNTFIPTLVKQLYPGEVDAAALDAGVERAKNTLNSAAEFEISLDDPDNPTLAKVKVTNNTGHKLPTGYPEGRRIWVNVQFYDASGGLISESGAYNFATGDLLHDAEIKIYHCEPGISSDLAAILGIEAGPSFHMALNDMVYFDNRIPPAGFTNAGLIEKQSPVVDHDGVVTTTMYPDGQNWDESAYAVPEGTYKIEARLYYQTASSEFVEFLRDENSSNTRGQEMYDLWNANGKSTPVVMNEAIQYIGTPPVKTISVDNVTFTRASAKGGKTYVTADVLVVDDGGQPVSGALVSGLFSGPTSDVVSGTTDDSGLVSFDSRDVKNPSGEWCLDITDIQIVGYDFIPTGTWCESGVKSAFIPANVNYVQKLEVYPNPFSERLRFEFTRAKDQDCTIELFDATGKKIEVLFNQQIKAKQNYQVDFTPEQFASEMLFYRIKFDNEVINGKVLYKK